MTSILLSSLALALVVTAAVAATQTAQPNVKPDDTRAEAPNHDPGVVADPGEAAPVKPVDPTDPNMGIPQPKEQCGSCTGTLGYFLDNRCGACGAKQYECASGCQDHGGVATFTCDTNGLYCECNDGLYDDCGCLQP